jgi:hypothetical protein
MASPHLSHEVPPTTVPKAVIPSGARNLALVRKGRKVRWLANMQQV